jgi:molybdopterin converting factor small subunit
VADEPTLGEAVRRLEDRFADLREDLQQFSRRLDEKVDSRIYDLRHDALTQRVATLEALREKDAERIVATRRWLVGAVIVPLVGILLPVIILLVRGAGS